MSATFLYFGSPSLQKTLSKIFDGIQFFDTQNELEESISQKYPHMIFLEDRVPDSSIQITSRIRNRFPEVQLPIVIFGTNSWLPYQKNSLSALQNTYRISSSLSPSRIQDQIDLLLDMNYFDRIEGECHPHALGLLITAFREEKSGVIHNQNRTIPLNQGGAITLDAKEQIEQFLHESKPQFEERESKGLGDWLLIRNILWDRVLKMTNPGFLSKRKKLRISIHTQHNRLFSLPLSDNVLKFLFESQSTDSIRSMLIEQNLPQSSVEREMEALYRMGFLSFSVPTKKQIELPTMKHIVVQSEEEAWKHLSSLEQDQNVQIERASSLFQRSLLYTQQTKQPTSSSRIEILNLMKANCYRKAIQKLNSNPSPTWESLQLICWSRINMEPDENRMVNRLKWLHEQHPTFTSSILLCTLMSEQKNFSLAQGFLHCALELQNNVNQVQQIKEKINGNKIIPRPLALRIVSNEKQQYP